MTYPTLPHRIQWHEGMLLTPQHFQQEGARQEALLAWQSLATNPYAWGVRTLTIDEALLNNGLLRVLQLDAILPNGMAISYDSASAQGATLELALDPWNADMTQRDVDIYLVVGITRSMNQPGQPSMFRGVESAPVEDEISQALPADLPRMTVNLSLFAGKLPPPTYIALRLMTANKANEVVRRGPYLPAMLALPADAAVLQRARMLAMQMRNKALFLARQTAHPSSRTEDRLAMLEQKGRLAGLILNLPWLEAVLRCPVVQPLPLYLALCAQLGPLATLRPGAVPLLPLAYDHVDIAPLFETVLGTLFDLVSEVSQEWKTVTFSFDGEAFALPLQSEWLGRRLVVGLRGQPEREAGEWMAGAVIGSQTIWTSLADRRVLGAPRTRIDEAAELGVRSSAGYTLFSIEASDAFIVAGQALLISNTNDTPKAQRPQEVVLFIRG